MSFPLAGTDFEPAYRELAVPDGHLAWWEEGAGGPPILWLHGLPLDGRSWEAQRRFFSPSCRNVFVDLRGYGHSSKLPAGSGDVTNLYCDDLTALIEAADLTDLVVVGFASAGHVALRLAARQLPRISKLVVINGSPRFRRGEDWPWGFADPEIDARFVVPLKEGRIEHVTDMILAPEAVFRDVTPGEAAGLASWFRPMSMNAGAGTLLGFFDIMSRDDDRYLLTRIGIPTLLMSSAIGREVPGEVARFIREQIPTSFLVEFSGVDHFAFATRPRLINAIIDDFRRS